MLSDCLSKEVKFHKDMSCLKMVKIWDSDDSNAFVYNSNRFTSEGLDKYWLSIDSAIRHWNVAIYPKIGKMQRKSNQIKDKYHWSHRSTSYNPHRR